MNFLPFISFLLIIISILNYSFFEKHTNVEKIYFAAKKQYVKNFTYKKQNQKFHHLTSKKKYDIKTAKKINFYPLLKEGKEQQKDLYNIFVRLLTLLSNEHLLKIEDSEKLANTLIKLSQQNPNTPIEKLILENETIQHAFYQILKEEPSLNQFATFSKKSSSKKLNFHKMPKIFFLVLFGEKTGELLFSIHENIKDENELTTFLKSHGFLDNYPITLVTIIPSNTKN